MTDRVGKNNQSTTKDGQEGSVTRRPLQEIMTDQATDQPTNQPTDWHESS